MKFSIKYFSSKCDQIRRKLGIWSHLLKKSLMENFIFCAVRFSKDILLPKISLLHPRPFKSDLLLAQFLTIFNKFLLQHLWNHKCYGLFSETCFKIPKLLTSSQKDTFMTHTVLKLIRCLQFSSIKGTSTDI